MSWPVVPLESLQADEPRAITDGPFGSNLARRHYTDAGPRVIRLQNIGDGQFIDNPAHITMEHFESLRVHEVRAGDLLVASLGEVLPRACLTPEWLGPAIVKADCIRIRLGDRADPRWVLYALERPAARRWAEEHRHGVGRPRLGLKVIREIPVPLPPLDEQRRIVEILDDHLSRLDAAGTYLKAVAAQRIVLHDQAFLSSVAPLNALSVRFSSVLASGLTNGRSVPTRAGGFPVLRLTALRDGLIDLNEQKDGDWTASDASKFLVEQGDFLIARGNGSLRLVGLGGLVGEVVSPVAFPDTLIRAKPDTTQLSPEYLSLVWNSRVVRRQLETSARTTAGIYKVNQKDLGAVTIPLPSLADQALLTSAARSLREAVVALAAAEDRSRRRLATLRHSLLTAAFSGRLTRDRQHLDTEELVSP